MIKKWTREGWWPVEMPSTGHHPSLAPDPTPSAPEVTKEKGPWNTATEPSLSQPPPYIPIYPQLEEHPPHPSDVQQFPLLTIQKGPVEIRYKNHRHVIIKNNERQNDPEDDGQSGTEDTQSEATSAFSSASESEEEPPRPETGRWITVGHNKTTDKTKNRQEEEIRLLREKRPVFSEDSTGQ